MMIILQEMQEKSNTLFFKATSQISETMVHHLHPQPNLLQISKSILLIAKNGLVSGCFHDNNISQDRQHTMFCSEKKKNYSWN